MCHIPPTKFKRGNLIQANLHVAFPSTFACTDLVIVLTFFFFFPFLLFTLLKRPCMEVPVPVGFGPSNGTNMTIPVAQQACLSYCLQSHTACYGAIVGAVMSLAGWTQELIDLALSYVKDHTPRCIS